MNKLFAASLILYCIHKKWYFDTVVTISNQHARINHPDCVRKMGERNSVLFANRASLKDRVIKCLLLAVLS